MTFLFFLGRKPELCLAELSLVTLESGFGEPTVLTDHIVSVELPSLDEAWKLQKLLGGTIKIAVVDSRHGDLTTQELEEQVAELLLGLPTTKNRVNFAIAEVGRDSLEAIDHKRIKHLLTDRELSVRFVEGPRFGLSASVLLHQNVDEVVCVRVEDRIYLGHTIAIQEIDEWTRRDRAKPAIDPKAGMLPPKLARTMINMATQGRENLRVLDPFCGTGTVLLEAAMLGHEVIGSDIRKDAVEQARTNLNWLAGVYNLDIKSTTIVVDATQIEAQLIGGYVDCIVAEGYLGPITPAPGNLQNIFKGLEKLYIGSLKRFTQVLANQATLCLALPYVEVKGKIFSVSSVIDRVTPLGYNIVSGPFLYDREEKTIVKRQIFVLKFER